MSDDWKLEDGASSYPLEPPKIPGTVEDSHASCIEWTGERQKPPLLAYGRVRVNGKYRMAHRMIWELANGSIPKGMCVLHRCDNPPCINLDHLFLGTRGENNRDRDAKGRTVIVRGERCAASKLTLVGASIAKAMHADGHPIKPLARKFGISQAAMQDIVKGRNWKEARPWSIW